MPVVQDFLYCRVLQIGCLFLFPSAKWEQKGGSRGGSGSPLRRKVVARFGVELWNKIRFCRRVSWFNCRNRRICYGVQLELVRPAGPYSSFDLSILPYLSRWINAAIHPSIHPCVNSRHPWMSESNQAFMQAYIHASISQ